MKKDLLRKTVKPFLTAGLALLVVLLGILDHFSGYQVSFSIFYLLPVLAAALYVGKKTGYLISILSAAAWLIADITAGSKYSVAAIPIWNGVMRLLFFVGFSYSARKAKEALTREQALARRDYLTNVGNARSFYEKLEIEVSRFLRFQRPFTVAYLDVDNFKQVNDTMGHIGGDAVLVRIAETIKAGIRGIDSVARLGGG